jgi:hypothetical protein
VTILCLIFWMLQACVVQSHGRPIILVALVAHESNISTQTFFTNYKCNNQEQQRDYGNSGLH